MLDDLALNILRPFLGAGVCVNFDIFCQVGLVWVAVPSSYHPKLSGSKGTLNGVISFPLGDPGCDTADVVSCPNMNPVWVSLFACCTTPVPVCTALSHLRVGIAIFGIVLSNVIDRLMSSCQGFNYLSSSCIRCGVCVCVYCLYDCIRALLLCVLDLPCVYLLLSQVY